jgi:hypothetical protein
MTENKKTRCTRRASVGYNHETNSIPSQERIDNIFDFEEEKACSERLEYTDWQSLEIEIPGFGNLPIYGGFL